MSKPRTDANRQALKDGFLQDMTDHQRMTGQEVTASENEKLALPVFEKLERMWSETKDRPAPPPKPKAIIPDDRSPVVAKAKKMGWRLTREPDPGSADLTTRAHPLTVEFYERLLRRTQLLMSKVDRGPLGQPSWQDRVLAIIYLRNGRVGRRRLTYELLKLCEESNEVFGDWKQDPVVPMRFDMGRANT